MSSLIDNRQRKTLIDHIVSVDWKNVFVICAILTGFFWLSADHHNDLRYLQIVQYERDTATRKELDSEQKKVLDEKIERIDKNVQLLISQQMVKSNRPQ